MLKQQNKKLNYDIEEALQKPILTEVSVQSTKMIMMRKSELIGQAYTPGEFPSKMFSTTPKAIGGTVSRFTLTNKSDSGSNYRKNK